jgi:hypothetical protein
MMTAKTKSKLPSTKLTMLFKEINSTFGHAKELVLKAYTLALQENYSPLEAKQLLLDNITEFKKTQIYAYLPSECKNPVKQKAAYLSHKTEVSVPESEQKAVTELTDSVSDSISEAAEADNYLVKLQSENITLRKEIEKISNEIIPEALLKKDRKIGELQREKADLEYEYEKEIERLRSPSAKDSSVSSSNLEQLSDEPIHLKNQVLRVYKGKLSLLGELSLPLRVHIYPQTDECTVEVDKGVAKEVFAQVCKELVTDKTEQ